MYHIYLVLSFGFICLFLSYFVLTKLFLVSVFCVILAGAYFKDDFIFRYLATHVACFYTWICDSFSGIQNMYHQSNNSNFPVRRCIENNGTIPRKIERVHQGSSYNLSTSYVVDNHSLNSGLWDSNSKLLSSCNNFNSRPQSPVQKMSKLNISQNVRGENSQSVHRTNSNSNLQSYFPPSVSSLQTSLEQSRDSTRNMKSSIVSENITNKSGNIENKPPLGAKLYADVSSPGFCSRVAERLSEVMTHQPKYDCVGAFPVVNLKSQSPKIKIKTPVRVRLAPPSNELVHYNFEASTTSRSPLMTPDDSMKSVLQVLKEISRKRMHSHVDEEGEEITKRLRVTDSQFDNDGLHTSLLQQTIQGKRAREESSPNEDDKKRRKPSSQNNEILSSLSSSISIQPPHLKTKKRKAQSIDDSITTTPVLGKLLKVQTEITPPPTTSHATTPPGIPAMEELAKPTSPLPSISLSEPDHVRRRATAEQRVAAVAEPDTSKSPEPEGDGAVSRLLGRMSSQTTRCAPIDIPIKKNVFMSTNDLSLSPPKENRLAAMIAVLGGPSEQSELENTEPEAPKQSERIIKGKALFTTPETPGTPETPKQIKKVTFSDSLTSTKVFERDEAGNGNLSAANMAHQTTLSTVTFGTTDNLTPTGPKLTFGTENTNSSKQFASNFVSSPLSFSREPAKLNEISNAAMTSSASSTSTVSPLGKSSMFQVQPTSSTATTSPPGMSGPKFSNPAQVPSSNSLSPSTGGFSFGTNNSVLNTNKEKLSKEDAVSPSLTTLSNGYDPKPVSSVSGFPSLFSTSTAQNQTTKTVETGSTSEPNKNMYNAFANKDTLSSANKKESEINPQVNGFAPTTTSSSPFSQIQTTTNKPLNPTFEVNSNTSTSSQSAPGFNFGSAVFTGTSTSSTTIKSNSTPFTSSAGQAAPSASANIISSQSNSTLGGATAAPQLNIFNSSAGSQVHSKPSPFGGSSQGATVFGDSAFKQPLSSSQTPQKSTIFGNTTSAGFGSNSSGLQNGTITSTSGTTQNNMFGNVSTPKQVPFGSGTSTTTQSSAMFGFPATSAPTQAASPFGIPLNSSASSGNTTTPQTTSIFASVTASTTNSQNSTFPAISTTVGQTPGFGSLANNDASKNMFASSSNPTTFGNINSTTGVAFGNQNNPPPAFGSQSITTSSAFGNQNAPVFSFGSQTTGSNPNPGGFGSSGTFGASSSTSSTNEVKPTPFASTTPFMFSNSSANKPTEPVKPLGTAAPFTFGSSVQQNSGVNPLQPSVPNFGAPTPTFGGSQAAPTFGGSQPTPTFGGSQPAPTFGGNTSQPAASNFQFGQASAAGPTFQFNAAPQAGAGMFSIGSGSSTRSKTMARRTKRT